MQGSGYFEQLYPRHIPVESNKALDRIELRFGNKVNALGSNNEGISAIRDLVAGIVDRPEHACALMIVAPHTHWGKKKPIVYSYVKHQARYLIGHQEISPSRNYQAVTFVMSPIDPLPYEWADESVELCADELHRAHDAIIKLNKLFSHNEWPLGIAIDFRFKSSLFEETVGTYEMDSDAADILQITKDIESENNFIQIGWPATRVSPYTGLSDNGFRVLNEIQDVLDGIDDIAAKQELLAAIQQSIAVPRG